MKEKRAGRATIVGREKKVVPVAESVRKWFSKRRYKSTTIKDYLKHLTLSSEITGKTFDEIAKEPKLRGIIIKELRKRGKKFINIYHHNVVMNLFWRANGWEIKDPYEYIPNHLRKEILRAKKFHISIS